MTVFAQRRPEHKLRRHRNLPACQEQLATRSTKAGAQTPATHDDPVFIAAGYGSLNEGWSTNSGRHQTRISGVDLERSTLNEGRSTNSGDTRRRRGFPTGGFPLNEGRSTNSGDTIAATTPIIDATTLNEGRSTNSGDTPVQFVGCEHLVRRSTKAGAQTPATRHNQRSAVSVHERSTKAGAQTPATPEADSSVASSSQIAQRRPEHKLRRHPLCLCVREHIDEGRSTKAGAQTPATPVVTARSLIMPFSRSTKAGAQTPATLLESENVDVGFFLRSTKAGAQTPATHLLHSRAPHVAVIAQRRPEHKLRRHRPSKPTLQPGGHRSTKAGAQTPATRAVTSGAGLISDTLNEGRSTNSGDTSILDRTSSGDRGSLNEGRSTNSGDTPSPSGGQTTRRRRSTKAGAQTPATPDDSLRDRLLERRSTKAGAQTPATHHRLNSLQRIGDRSTKAGAQTPATHDLPEALVERRDALNEGRSTNSGDTHAPNANCPGT